jgi:hypothetical protein
LRWLRLHPANAVAPMHFPTLFAQCEPPTGLAAIVADLIARKAVTRELGSEPLPEAVAAFIDAEFAIAARTFEKPAPRREESLARAEAFFIAALRRLAPQMTA